MKGLLVLIQAWGLAVGLPAATPPQEMHFFDETTNRHLKVTPGDFGKVTLVFRMVGSPGSAGVWIGDGTRKDKEIAFAQTVGEDQERGTYFIAKGGESKLEIGFQPGQREPQDAGINGIYRRITDEKRLSLARKEAAAADDLLLQTLKTVPKTWPAVDREVAAQWRTRWPDLRARWLALVTKPAAASPATTTKPPLGARASDPAADKPAEHWIAQAEATAMANNFLSAPLDKIIPPNWDGEYDDGFGGHASLRFGRDGFLRFTLSCTRGSGDGQTGEIIGRIPANALKKEANGDFTASYRHQDAELKPEDQQAVVNLRKSGHFLFVETQYAERYRGRAWFDGIYRWGPVPAE